MKSLISFINSFLKNSGHHVIISILIAKLCGFVSSLIIIHLLSPKEFGWVSVVFSISIIFLSVNGFGSHQILLRYGSIIKDNDRKDQISDHVFHKGFLYQILISLIFITTSLFYLEHITEVLYIFGFFFVRLLGYYFYNHIQSYLRIKGDNKGFAKVNNTVNIVGLVSVLVLTFFFGLYGYLIAFSLAPFISLFWLPKIKVQNLQLKKSLKKQMWSFGLFSILTALLSDLLFTIDVILIAYLMNEVAAAEYRIALLIPANIVFLSATFLQSDYPTLAKNYKNKNYIYNYIKNYYKLFIPICIAIFTGSYFLKTQIINLFFGEKYPNLELPFMIGIAAFCISMLSRTIFGNLVSAIGEMRFNTISSLVTLITLITSSLILVPLYGVIGMTISMFISVTTNGIMLMLLLFYKTKQLT